MKKPNAKNPGKPRKRVLAQEQFERELTTVINRWSQESDLSGVELLFGVDAVRGDLATAIRFHRQRRKPQTPNKP